MKNLIPYFVEGNLAVVKGEWKKAIVNYKIVLDLDPENIEALIGISHSYIRLSDYDVAETYSEKAFEIRHKYSEADVDMATVNYSDVLIERDDFEKAIEILSLEKNLNSRNYLVYNNLGYAYQKIDNFQEALCNYNLSIELESDNPLAFCNRGELRCFHLDDLKGGVNDLISALKLGDLEAEELLKTAIGLKD